MKKWMHKWKRKHIVCIMLLVGFIIAVISAFLFSKTEYDYESYGAVQSQHINFDDSVVLESVFSINEENFDGVGIYLSFEGEQTEDSLLRFLLYDEDSDELLCQYDMDLEYELTNKVAYAPLPVVDSRGKNVRLVIKGDNLKTPVKVFTSKNYVNEMTLYRNGEKSNRYLVMQAVYAKKQSIVVDVVVYYILFACVVILIGYRHKLEGRQEEYEEVKEAVVSRWNRFANCFLFLKKHKQVVYYIITVFSLILVFVFYHDLKIKDLLKDKEIVSEMEKGTDAEVILDAEHTILEQSFFCSEDGMSAIVLEWRAEQLHPNAVIKIRVLDADSQIELFEKRYKAVEILEEQAVEYAIYLNQSVGKSEEKEYLLQLEVYNMDDMRIILTGTEYHIYQDNVLIIQNQESVKDIAIDVIYNDNDFVNILFLCFAALILISVSAMYYMLFYKKCTMEQIFAVLAITFGTLYMFTITMYAVPDESSHIDTVYRYSNRLMGISESEKPGYDYKRADDVDVLSDSAERTDITLESYQRLYYGLFEKVEDEQLVECYMRNNVGNGGLLCYFPAVIGITVGRLLHFGTMPMLLLGRFCNLVGYVILCYFAIKRLPYGKSLMLLIGTLPMTMQEAASFSYDALINGYIFLFVALCIALANKKESIMTKDLLAVLLLGMLMIGCKGGVYSPLCLLVLYIPWKRGEFNKKNCLYYLAMLIVMFITFMKSYIVYILNRLFSEQGNAARVSDGEELYTFQYLFAHPWKLISLALNTLFHRGDTYLNTTIGGNLGWFTVSISWMYIIAFLILLLLSSSMVYDKVNKKEKVLFGGLAFLSFCLVNLSMLIAWTPVTLDYITGVQGRYFLPFLFLGLVACCSKIFRVERENRLIFTSVILQFLVLLRIIVVSI